MPLHRVKQKKEERWIFNVSGAIPPEWNMFMILSNSYIENHYLDSENLPSRSTLSFDQKMLNYRWNLFATALLQAAHENIPKKKFSTKLHRDKQVSDNLWHLQKQTSLLNNIYSIIHSYIYDLHGSATKEAQIQRLWSLNSELSKRSCLLTINGKYKDAKG